jgi:hypothetical protein
MSSNYSGTNTFTDYFTIPDDGDAINASSFNVAFEALGDRTVALRTTLTALDAFVVATGVSTTAHLATLDSEVAALYAAMQDGVWSLRHTNGTLGTTLSFSPSVTTFSQTIGSAVFAKVGDRFTVAFTSTVNFVHNSGQGIVVTAQLQVSENGGGYSNVANASIDLELPAQASTITAGWRWPFTLTATHDAISSAGNAQFRVLFTAGFGVSATGDEAQFTNNFATTQYQIRLI